MNGPESLSQGVPVANEKKPRWSKVEAEKGEDILFHIKSKIGTIRVGSQYAQASIAAHALGLISQKETFKNLPSGIKSYLEFVWKTSSQVRLPSDDEWLAEVDHHTLHPEDEVHIIDALSSDNK